MMKIEKRTFWILVMALSLFSILLGQEDMNEKMEKARQLEADGQPEQAISIYEVVYQQDSKNKPLTFKIAGLAYQVKNYKKAIKYYEILAPNGNPTVLYNLACSCALAGKQGKAIKYLELAVDKGFNQVSLMRTDPDLISIRNHKKFESIVSSAKSIENIPEARAFDFWVGEWTVYYPNKQKVGDSKIEKILKGAVILENWTGVSGVTGKSFNHYHIDSGKWVQYWVDQASGRIHYEGNFDPDLKALVYYEVNRESNTLLKRLTFYDLAPDSVRQHSEIRSSENDPWATEYDFTYVRK